MPGCIQDKIRSDIDHVLIAGENGVKMSLSDWIMDMKLEQCFHLSLDLIANEDKHNVGLFL